MTEYLENLTCDLCGGTADFIHTNSGNCSECGLNLCQDCTDWHDIGEDTVCDQCYRRLTYEENANN